MQDLATLAIAADARGSAAYWSIRANGGTTEDAQAAYKTAAVA